MNKQYNADIIDDDGGSCDDDMTSSSQDEGLGDSLKHSMEKLSVSPDKTPNRISRNF